MSPHSALGTLGPSTAGRPHGRHHGSLLLGHGLAARVVLGAGAGLPALKVGQRVGILQPPVLLEVECQLQEN